MRKDYLDKIKSSGNEWLWDEDFKANLICTDDADSVLSCLMLINYFPDRFQIGYYYDFRDGFYTKMGIDESLAMVGIDLSHPNIRCISNHLTKKNQLDDTVNKNDINLNIIDGNHAGDYHAKYNLNTLLLVSSLCGHSFDNEVGKVVAMLPDSSFLGRFSPYYYQDRGVQEKYLNILGYGDVLELQDRHGIDKFYSAQEALNIKSKVWVTEDGIEFKQDVSLGIICKYLEIDYDPSVLEGLFYLTENHRSFTGATNRNYDKSNMFSFAITRKGQVKYSREIVKND